jgi:carotenoid cleavage dioxygenase-like enzyme
MATDSKGGVDRRALLGGAVLGAGALAAGTSANAEVQFPKAGAAGPFGFGAGGAVGGATHRSENDLYDCEVEGKLPSDLDGAFYRVGPDPQYPKPDKYAVDIPFDGEGHVSMFRIKDGHVDYKSRYVRNQRWKAQHAARRSLFGMYRNPGTDDPSVKGLSRGTANTQIVYHHGKLFAMKEDSPPVAMDPLTLETTDDYYTFGGGMKSLTFTAHPKLDPMTGEMIAFGYEAKGFYTPDIEVFSADKTGKVIWSAWVKSPYTCMIHDFAVTQKHIAFLATPLAANPEQVARGGVHWAWDSTLPSYLGVMRRGGDGKDIQWIKGPGWMATHTMGAWSDGDKLYFDVDGAPSNQFPFFPQVHEPFDGKASVGRVVRLTADMSKKSQDTYGRETLFPQITGQLSRQDDRYHTVPYRYGILNGAGWHWIDHQTGKVQTFTVPDTQLQEASFVPRRKGAPEGDGYLIGVGTRTKENGRSDLVIADTKDLAAGPVAVVHMPYKIVGQVHGFWVEGHMLPQPKHA